MSDDLPQGLLFGLLLLLLCLSAFFASSESGMTSINRYRLSHRASVGESRAQRAVRLLSRPERLSGGLRVGSLLVHSLAAVVATLLAVQHFGVLAGGTVATLAVTLALLIFGEVAPRSLAAARPERTVHLAAPLLEPLLKALHPLAWLADAIASGLLRLVGVKRREGHGAILSRDELRSVVHEAGPLIPQRHQTMLLSILDLENVTVNDIMVPRHEVVGIDLDDDLDEILIQIRTSQHTRIPVYKGDINNVIGILHLRNAARFLVREEVTKAAIVQEAREPYFIPESTPLHTQLLNFQKQKRRIGIVVDEYGDVEGLVTLEDILEEIVGEFTTDVAGLEQEIQRQEDGSLIIEGTATIRDINKALGWQLPTDGPKTLNGLILEHLEGFPAGPASLQVDSVRMEILEVRDKLITSARCWPAPPPRREPRE